MVIESWRLIGQIMSQYKTIKSQNKIDLSKSGLYGGIPTPSKETNINEIGIDLNYSFHFVLDYTELKNVNPTKLQNLDILRYFVDERGEYNISPIIDNNTVCLFVKITRIVVDDSDNNIHRIRFLIEDIDDKCFLSQMSEVVFYLPRLYDQVDTRKNQYRLNFVSGDSALIGTNAYDNQLNGFVDVQLIRSIINN